jgi:hypothetical protein
MIHARRPRRLARAAGRQGCPIMTLSPIFRSEEAVRLLHEHGVIARLAPALQLQMEGVLTVQGDLAEVIGPRFRLEDSDGAPAAAPVTRGSDPMLAYLQDYFFLTLFLAIFKELGIVPERLPFYAQLDFCIMGTITAADDLFDGQDKTHLPLRPASGALYGAILQLMCFERLTRRVGDRAASWLPAERFADIQRGLLDLMAEIGILEGSEERGVGEIPTPEDMIRKVHAVRGGMLFGLAMVAPEILESGQTLAKLRPAGQAVRALGTAFQIVDDLTDFEFDLTRKSHNLLVSRIHHCGSPEEKAKLARLWAGEPAEPGLVEGLFAGSARAVLEEAYRQARASLTTLAGLGFWFPPELADQVVHAIVGLDGVARMQGLAASEKAQ